jgi:hypothetical protein
MKIYILPALLVLSACVPAAPYAPIIDRPGPHYERDIAACRVINDNAQRAAADKQAKEMVGNMVLGALVGAAVGGNNQTAAYGAAAGLAGTDMSSPRYIVDRCMAGRGYNVLSDM